MSIEQRKRQNGYETWDRVHLYPKDQLEDESLPREEFRDRSHVNPLRNLGGCCHLTIGCHSLYQNPAPNWLMRNAWTAKPFSVKRIGGWC
jgi:hypothetical protein